MKKILLIVGLISSTVAYSQHEIKIDIADALVIRSIEFSYESYLTEDSSVGISTLFNLAISSRQRGAPRLRTYTKKW